MLAYLTKNNQLKRVHMENKEILFTEIIEKYHKEVNEGIHTEGINEYLAKIAKEYNKKYFDSFPPAVKKEDRDPLLSVSWGGDRARFFDIDLDHQTELMKLNELDELPLQDLEKLLVDLTIDYIYTENRKSSGKVVANPMNVFASNMFIDFVKDKIDDTLFKDQRYTKREILFFYYYESKGYRKIISKIMSTFFTLLLEYKNIKIKDVATYVRQEAENEYILNAQKKGSENILELKCVFKNGYYNYWNDNDDRYVSDFDLDRAVPDYEFLLA